MSSFVVPKSLSRSWPPRREVFEPLNRTQRVQKILADVMQHVPAAQEMRDVDLTLNIAVKDDSVGLPDCDVELTAMVARQVAEAFAKIAAKLSPGNSPADGEDMAGACVLA